MNTMALSVTERIHTLGICPVFSGVPPADLAVLAEMMVTERLRAGELLFASGDPSDRIYVVAGGSLSVILPGEPRPVRTLGPGDLLGEYAMFSNMARTATVRADTDAVLLCLDYPRFRAFLLQFPEAALVLLKAAVQRLTALEGKHRSGVPSATE
jgi:CRP/FNR family transcriptional regulator